MIVLLLLLFVALFLLLLAAFGAYFTWGELVQWEHDFHFDQWCKDGRPFGFFHRPDTGDLLILWWQSYPLKTIQSFALSTRWLFWSPLWIRGDEDASRWLWRFRACMLIWGAGSVPYFIWLWQRMAEHSRHMTTQ